MSDSEEPGATAYPKGDSPEELAAAYRARPETEDAKTDNQAEGDGAEDQAAERRGGRPRRGT